MLDKQIPETCKDSGMGRLVEKIRKELIARFLRKGVRTSIVEISMESGKLNVMVGLQ